VPEAAGSTSAQWLYQVLSGGLFLGAIFMATDYVTSPITPWGKAVMGIGCGVILFVIREFNPAYPEGCSFAILLMNLLTPLLNRVFRPTMFGETDRRLFGRLRRGNGRKDAGEVKNVA
jgi:Na+-translocating ferredoxin:NAD+ oxidoreductase RnfD subunit